MALRFLGADGSGGSTSDAMRAPLGLDLGGWERLESNRRLIFCRVTASVEPFQILDLLTSYRRQDHIGLFLLGSLEDGWVLSWQGSQFNDIQRTCFACFAVSS